MWIEIILGLALFVSLLRQLSIARDLKSLDDAISHVGPDGKLPPTRKIKNRNIQRIFSSIVLILSKFRPQNFDISQEAITMGAMIASNVSEANGVAQALSNAINQKVAAELIGVAVLVNDSGKLKITQAEGLALKRIGTVIETNCQDAQEIDSWGYQQVHANSLLDFSVFGIKRILLVPMKYQDQIQGVIWLGLASSSLSSEKAEVVKKLAEYAAASFQTAKMFGREKEFQQKENDFLLGLSHDLRSPGNRALFCIRDLLFDSSLSKQNREQLEIVEFSIDEQMTMINDVLDIAKHQGGVLVSKPKEVNLYQELDSLRARYSSDLQRKNLLAEFNCPSDLMVYVDSSHLRRILNNLMCNAIKFTNFGGIFIDVEILEDNVEIVFKDTGAGVASTLPLFEKYSQGQSNKPGYGLGLSLVRVLAEINNGQVVSYPSSFSGANLGVRVPLISSLLRANC